MIEIHDSIPKPFRKEKPSKSLNELISLLTIIGIVCVNVWVGYIRFLGLEKHTQDLFSFQTLLFSRSSFLGLLPFAWGFGLWLVINWVYGLFCRDESLEPWKLIANICFGEGVSLVRSLSLLLVGLLIPYMVLLFCSLLSLMNILTAPGTAYLIFALITILFWIHLRKNYEIHKKRISRLTRSDLAFKKLFYDKTVPIMLVFSLVIGLQVIPEGIGKVWGLYRVFSGPSQEVSNPIMIDISPRFCWPDLSPEDHISHFMDIKGRVVYLHKLEDPDWGSFFPIFLFDHLFKGENLNYQLCVISIEQIKLNGDVPYSIELINPPESPQNNTKVAP